MATLNQIGSRIAGILGRQADHALIERAKDAFKAVFATRVRQSIATHGIDELLNITCRIPLVIDKSLSIHGFKTFITSSRVPVPVRFQNDSPFISVSLTEGEPISNRTILEVKMSNYGDVKGFNKYYNYENGYIRVFVRTKYDNLELTVNGTGGLIVKSIFENPEEAIAFYSKEDTQDMILPIPTDMVESIILEVLKIEFNYVPKEVELKV